MTKNNLPNVSIILPCYNEEECLETVISEIHSAFEKKNTSYEIIAIDDCSTDRTPEILQSLDVMYLKNEKNIGAGASRRKGIDKAQYDIIAYIDADLTYTAADLLRLLYHFPESDHVIGYRDREMGYCPHLRKLIKAIARYFASILIWEYIADLNSGLRAFKKSSFKDYMHFLPKGFSCVTTMTVLSYCLGHQVSYISTHYKKRVGQSKFHPVKDTFKLFFTIIRTVTIYNPFKAILFFITITTALATLLMDYSKVTSSLILTFIFCNWSA